MSNTKTKILALVASTALVAMLGLAACGGSSSTSAASSAASGSASAASESASSATASEGASSAAASASTSSSDSASLAALAQEIFQNYLVGKDDKNVLYFYEQGDDDKTASLLVYDIPNKALAVHSGTYEEPTFGTVRIDTKGAGDAIEFKVAPNADKSAVTFTFDNGASVVMGSVIDEDTKKMLDELDQLIAKVNNSTEAQ